MSSPSPLKRAEAWVSQIEFMRLGIVLERRRIGHPWQDHAWLPVAVLPEEPAAATGSSAETGPSVEEGPWRLLEEAEG